MERMIGVIGGSGVYEIAGLENARWQAVETPWGAPSDEVLRGRLNGVEMAFLPRHGRGHVHTPTTVPYRANIAAMKMLGVTDLVAVSAVGSLKEAYAPGDFLVVDQYIDRTFAREKSFFGPGLVGHVSVAHPVCSRLSAACVAAARSLGVTVHEGGTYVRDGGAAILDAGREPPLSQLGRGCDRHDRHARGETPRARRSSAMPASR